MLTTPEFCSYPRGFLQLPDRHLDDSVTGRSNMTSAKPLPSHKRKNPYRVSGAIVCNYPGAKVRNPGVTIPIGQGIWEQEPAKSLCVCHWPNPSRASENRLRDTAWGFGRSQTTTIATERGLG